MHFTAVNNSSHILKSVHLQRLKWMQFLKTRYVKGVLFVNRRYTYERDTLSAKSEVSKSKGLDLGARGASSYKTLLSTRQV